jgi:polyvinyl alcohol dehydrogenase (cytochrome)
VLLAITSGSMARYADGLSDFDKRALAVYVGGRPFGAAVSGDVSQMKNVCTSRPAFAPFNDTQWNGWGFDATNTRFQTSPGLTMAEVPNLVLKWAFGFPSGNSAYAQPSVAGGRVFVGADTGFVYAIDASSGCAYWSFRADAGVRTAVTIGRGNDAHRYIAYFGDIRANVYAVDAETAQLVWRDRLDSHPVARITGAPVLSEGRLFVPLSSLEESGAGNPNYPCCTFRGGIAAYDAVSGRQLWKSYTIAEQPTPIRRTSKGTQLWAPAGAGVWSAPTIDVKRRAVYVATGNGYTEPAARGSDAVIAFAIENGQRLWTNQVMAGDAYVRDCPGVYRPNVPTDNKSETCPDDLGPDMDFGNAPILQRRSNGADVIVVGQKDGHVWALDPDRQGKVVWSRQIGLGLDPKNPGTGGAIMWGSASDTRFVYTPLTRAREPLGVAAVALDSGTIAWRASPAEGGAAPVTVIPGVLFFGSSSGTVYAYATSDGHAIWQFDTAREFETVNGVAAKGGSITSAGPVVAAGMLFVPSGYSELGNGVRGNVLLAFGQR